METIKDRVLAVAPKEGRFTAESIADQLSIELDSVKRELRSLCHDRVIYQWTIGVGNIGDLPTGASRWEIFYLHGKSQLFDQLRKSIVLNGYRFGSYSNQKYELPTISTRFFEDVPEIIIPMLPNFINTTNVGKIAIEDCPDQLLKHVGELWTDELIKRAQKKRK